MGSEKTGSQHAKEGAALGRNGKPRDIETGKDRLYVRAPLVANILQGKLHRLSQSGKKELAIRGKPPQGTPIEMGGQVRVSVIEKIQLDMLSEIMKVSQSSKAHCKHLIFQRSLL